MEALDSVGRLGRPVDAAEHQRGVAEIEIGEPLEQGLVERIALEPGLERAAEVGLGHVAHAPRRLAAGVETLVRVVDVGLLVSEIGVLLGHNGSRNAIGVAATPDRTNRRCGPGDSVVRRWMPSPHTTMRHRLRPPLPTGAKRSSTPPTAGAGHHTPVWFMRQAGRSLPEYRAVRGEGSILDAIKQPALAAEITLQPVRRYGVDAAVLYSDIVVPAHAVGFGIDVAPGTGPVVEHPLRSSADLERLRPLEFDDISYVIDTVDLLVARTRRPAARLRRRAVHRGELPDRGSPEQGLPAHQGADAHRRGALARGDGAPRRVGDHVHRRAARRTVRAAFQLFDSWAGSLSRRDYDRFVLPHSRHVFGELRRRHPDAPAIHFGIGCDHLLDSMLAAGPTVLGLDWRTPIADARRRLGDDLVVQGNLDPALVLAGREPALAGAVQVLATTNCPTAASTPATSSTSATACSPTPIPACSQAVVDLVHERTAATRNGRRRHDGRTRRRRADGVRHAAHARRDRAVLHRHPPRPPADAPSSWPTSPPATRRSAASPRSPSCTEAQRAALQAALDAAEPGTVRGRRSGSSTPSRRSRTPRRALSQPTVSDAVVGLVLAPHYSSYSIGQYLERTAPGRRRAGCRHPGRRHRELGGRTRLRRVPRRRPRRPGGRDARAHRRRVACCSPPTRCRSGSSTPAIPTRTSCARPRRPSPRGRPDRGRRLGDRLAVGRAHARAVDRPRHPRGDRRARRRPTSPA